MTLEDKARELGRMLGQSPEYQAVKRASDALNNDREASTLLRQMEQLQLEAQRLIERGEQPPAEMEQRLETIFDQVQTSRIYQDWAVAQENFEKVMQRVNQWILEGIRKGSASPIITLG